MLTNSLNVSDTTKTEFFELTFSQSAQKILQKYCWTDLSSDLEPLTSLLPISFLTRGLLLT